MDEPCCQKYMKLVELKDDRRQLEGDSRERSRARFDEAGRTKSPCQAIASLRLALIRHYTESLATKMSLPTL